jgi:hypothetical protein
MTRDEAIAIWDAEPHTTRAGGLIDVFVKLGMLKLEDVPQEPQAVFCREDDDWNWWLNQTVAFKAASVKQLRAKPVPGNCNQPKGPRERFIDAMFAYPSSQHGLITPRGALYALDHAGLKIVEKQ